MRGARALWKMSVAGSALWCLAEDGANGGIANPCGGFEPLRYENVSAAPACLAPNELGCIGETADACSDAGAGGASGQAGAESSGSGGPFAGSRGTSGNDIGNRDDYGCTRDANTYNGRPAKPGDACGPCGDGHLGCSSVSTKLTCAGATIADYCAAVADAPNSCGGKGPTTWRGVSNTVGFRCGACGNGGLACATKNTLTCVTSSSTFSGAPSCNHASPQSWGRYGVAFTYGSDYYGPGTLYVGKSVLVP
jgi:hypothetical protein